MKKNSMYPSNPVFSHGATATMSSSSTANTRPSSHLETKVKVPWSTGLFDCFSDWRTCCITYWCPCITFGKIAEIVDKGSSSFGVNCGLYTVITFVVGCTSCYSCFYRSKMRQQYSLQESPCGDCLVHCCCKTCALCQEYRELQNQGYDLSLGWYGNVKKKNGGLEMASVAPMVESGMRR